MIARAKSKAKKAEAAQTVIVAVKSFDADLKCRNFQYKIGGTYIHDGKVEICSQGFHACEMPLDAWTYYGPAQGSRYCTVELGGATANNDGCDSKIAAAEITIKAEVRLPQVIRSAVEWILARAKGNTATGDSGHAAATGDYGHAAATGGSGHAAATGYSGHAAATGDYGHAAAMGAYGHAAATGDYGHAAVKGKNAIAAAFGKNGTAKAEAGGAIMLAAYDDDWNLVAVFSSKVGENGIKAGVTYRLGRDGKPQAPCSACG